MSDKVQAFLSGETKLSAAAIAVFAAIWAFLIVQFQGPVFDAFFQDTGLYQTLGVVWQQTIVTIVLFGLLIGMAFLWGWLGKHSVFPFGERAPLTAASGLAAGVLGLLTAFGFVDLAGSVHGYPAQSPIGGIALATVLVLYQSAGEEIFFRGWIQPVLARGFGPWIAVAVTSVLFSLLHILVGNTSPVSILNTFLAGVFFGLLAWRTGGMLAPVLAHAGWNWAESTLLGLDPNPGRDPMGTVWNFDLTGSGLWGGSAEGMNASLAVTFVLLALIVPLALYRQPIPTAVPA